MALSDPLNLLGTTIADKYAIESVVGEGGFAIVYRAQHQLWKRPVAVKVFKALGEVAVEQRAKLLEEFIREGALLAELSERSAAIVQARDIGTIETKRGEALPYMVLEWLEGSPLDAVLAQEKEKGMPLRSIEETVRLLDLAAEALALAHAKGIAHRDVKPANVFVLGDARAAGTTVKLLDFGIAKVVQDAQKMAGAFSKTSGQITSFTPAYGAPEQYNRAHGATGPWTDVFALALIAVEMLTGNEPLVGDNLMQLAYASADRANRPTPRARGATVNDEVERVFAKAVAVGPDERYKDAGEFWNELRAAIRLEPMRAVTHPSERIAATELAAIESAKTVMGPTVPATASTLKEPTAPKRGGFLAAGALGILLGAGTGIFLLTRPATPTPPAAAACPSGMLRIPGGMFYMGSDDPAAVDNEKPAHQVRLSSFCIDELEVTVARYKACADNGGCKKAPFNAWHGLNDKDRAIYDPLCNAVSPDVHAQHPINCVNWEMASHYCEQAGLRLPTEAEWEFSARGPDGRKYPWGDEAPSHELLNACGTECVAWGKTHALKLEPMYAEDDRFANTAPVGSFPKGKSRYGVQDVVGNVWEWVADRYAPYPKNQEQDPKGPAAGDERVIRGGSWNGSMPSWVRPTFRFKDDPEKRSYGIGFRCAKSS